MNSNLPSKKAPGRVRRVEVLLVLGGVVVLALAFLWLRGTRSRGAPTAYHEVKRGDFTVSVVEGGTLAAVSEVVIRNEVEGTARIISIVPEGSYVKKGDLLVELDSAQAQDQANQQQIAYEKAKFAVEQAEAQLEIQRSATNSDYLKAALTLKFAKIDQEKYEKGQRLVDLVEASNKVVQAQAQLAVNQDTYRNSTNLAAKGYETKQKEDSDRLAVLNTGNQLIVASNSISMLEIYDVPKSKAKYESDVLQAEQELERVLSQNARKMAQYEADLKSQINTLKLSEQKLARDQKNLTNTTIIAPQDGLVVYQVSENRFSSESLIEGGATVRNRQELIKLPDLSRMKITVKVHESHVNMVHPGQAAFVVLDSMPDVRFRGVVDRVAPLPDTQSRWGNPNLKVYNTDILVTDTLPNVKPGVSAKAEIIVTNIADTLSVPIQAVTTLKGRSVVYLANGAKAEPRPVEVGLFNIKFLQVVQGLKDGDRVLLSPPFDTEQRGIDEGLLDDDEKARIAKTNLPVAVAKPAGPTSTNGLVASGESPRAPGQDRGLGQGPSQGSEGLGQGTRDGSGRRGGPPSEEMLKRFDKDGDGQLNDEERQAMREAMRTRFGGGQGPGPGFGTNMGGMGRRGGALPEEILKQFDKDGDGKLNEEERQALMQEGMRRFGGGQGPGPGFGTNMGGLRPEGGRETGSDRGARPDRNP